MNREEVARLVLSASTLEQCEAAEAALRRWLDHNPDDIGMQEIGEGLAMLRDALTPPGDDAEPAPEESATNGRRNPAQRRSEEMAFALSFENEVRLAQEEL